jgi:putative redox protein
VSSRCANASWEPGPLRCEVAVDGFTIPVDEPESVGGTGGAPQPTDLFLASVASCFALALVHSAGKRGAELGALAVNVIGDYAGTRFDAVRIVVNATGPQPAELEELIEAAERICYVTNTLRSTVNVTVTPGGGR